MFIPNNMYYKVVPWMIQRKQNFALLLHPNTGCPREDYTKLAIWGGQPMALDIDYFNSKSLNITPKQKFMN